VEPLQRERVARPLDSRPVVSDLRASFTTWRRLGVRRGTAAGARLASAQLLGSLRRERLRIRPLRVGPAELSRALDGADPMSALRERALPALPTVTAWERDLEQLDVGDRTRLLERADRVLAHRFDLLGSGPTALGPAIDWQRDFKSGRRWPDAHISQVPTVLGGGSDIKVPWELARGQHLPLLSAAHRLSDESRYLDELGAQLSSFIASNPVELGVAWSCTMDVAIRAANWLAALCMAMPAAARAPWLEPALASLLLHCRFIRAHLEWGEVRGNHYLSDVVGLLLACAPFSASTEGRAWARWATAELEREMRHQVRGDGCDHEASIPYHRLVAELFVCGTQAADALCPGSLSDGYRERLGLMLDFVSDYTRPDGLAPQIGDADDGRFLPLGDYGADPRDHRHLYKQAGRRWREGAGHVAYPQGGWYVMRHGGMWAIVRCGDVGLGGIGAHAHNDQLSFELAMDAQPLIVDPGSYLYTADPRARNEFRSTLAHSTLCIGGSEQNRLRSDYLFTLPEQAHARCTRFEIDGPRALFEGEHTGFRALPRAVRHRRELRFDGESGTVCITDTVLGAEGEELLWSFPLAPGEATVQTGRALARFAHGALAIVADGVALEVESGWLSPSYGVRAAAPVIRARRVAQSGEDVTRFTLSIGEDLARS
jgi:Heparinase II/III-like protein/Heparinase II/III N-terminus